MASIKLIGVAAAAAPLVAVAGVGAGELQDTETTPSTVTYAPSVAAPQVGTNIGPITYYTTAMPLIDVMKGSSRFLPQRSGQWDTGETLGLDQNGWVNSVPVNGKGEPAKLGVTVLADNEDAAPANTRYVVLYDGAGTINGMLGTTTVKSERGRVTVRSSDSGSLHLKLEPDTSTSSSYLRNIRVVREDQLSAYQSGQMFNPEFLARLRGFNVVRFMDFMETNQIYRRDGTVMSSRKTADLLGVEQLRWADRPKTVNARWSRGAPVEAMVQLANELDADPWFTMPINASDEYVRSFASYVRQNLEPELKVHVELSNEVWNWSFPQAHYAKAYAEQRFGKGAHYMEWYGVRSAEVGAIWNQAFGEPVTGTGDPGRVRVVYSTQFAHKGLELPGLKTEDWKDSQGRQRKAADYFDEYAVASYYDGGMHSNSNASEVMSWWRLADGGYKKAIEALWAGFERDQVTLFPYHGTQAQSFGLDLVTYEAGYGELTPYEQHDNDQYTDFLIKLQRRSEIYDLDMANAEALAAAGGTLFVNYGIIGEPSKWGSWNALESVKQETSPRYRALQEMIRRYKGGETTQDSGGTQVSIDCRVLLIKSLSGEWQSGGISDADPNCNQTGTP